MTVVLDTNVIVPATYFGGKPASVLERALHRKFSVALSVEIFTEYIQVLNKLSTRYSAKADWLNRLLPVAKFFAPEKTEPLCSDPDDEIFIQCAVAARANFIVSGDKRHLLKLNSAHGIPIISVAQFLELLGATAD